MAAPPDIEQLVNALAGDPHGLGLLANALDSVEEELIDPSLVRDLLSDLAAEVSSVPGARWPDALARVCHGRVPGCRKPGGYLRATRPHRGETCAVSVWTTVISASVWKSKHMDLTKKRATPLPSFPPAQDKVFQEQFDALVKEPDWYQHPTPNGGAWLGRPAADGANCWISCTALDAEYPPLAKNLRGSARRIVEALGILPISPLQCYVRYWIDAESRMTSGGEGRRPCFADLGNEWFRVKTAAAAGRHHGRYGWGTTANISTLRAVQSDDNGRPERVSPSIPVGSTVLRVEILFPKAGDHRPLFARAPRDQFKLSILRKRTDTEVRDAVLQLWDAGSHSI